jgi:hypothetical protein
MSKGWYLVYVILVVLVVLVMGREDDEGRSWGRSGRAGWSAGASHK